MQLIKQVRPAKPIDSNDEYIGHDGASGWTVLIMILAFGAMGFLFGGIYGQSRGYAAGFKHGGYYDECQRLKS